MNIQEERERVKQIIIDRLSKGSTYRKDLHLECCRQLGKSTSHSLNLQEFVKIWRIPNLIPH